MSIDVSPRVLDLDRLADFARAGFWAVITEHGEHSYADLLARVEELVAGMQDAKMQHARIGILFDRSSLDGVAALIATHAVGGSFVLFDPHAGDERGRDLIARAELDYLLGSPEHARAFGGDRPCLSIEALGEGLPEPARAFEPASGRTSEESYIVFTSGSTGTPKGVRVGAAAIGNHVSETCRQLDIDSSSVLLQYAATQFDVCVSDLLCALTSGAAIRIVTNEERHDLERLKAVMRNSGVTHMSMPPSTMALIDPEDAPLLRVLNLGGEVAAEAVLRRWSERARIVISYGPSECAVSTSSCAWSPHTTPGSIGAPHAGVEYRVLDPDGSPVACGEAGELVIAGCQVMEGYLGAAGPRVYATGDLVRELADGNFVFSGRADRQVKINGTGRRITHRPATYDATMPELELLRADHGPALLAFEQENRAYFAASVPDRGDDYFTHFDSRHAAILAGQTAGLDYFHVVLDTDGQVLGRVNLVDVADGAAELGFRIAEKAAGRRLATTAVRQVLDLAGPAYGLHTLRARTTTDNSGSCAVLTRTGFLPTGETRLGERPGVRYTLLLPRTSPTP